MAEFLTKARFLEYFPELVIDQRKMPNRREAVITLLVSVMSAIPIARPQTERNINEKLQAWINDFGFSIGIDRVTLRRMLVDEGYLHRDRFGKTYVLGANSPYFGYEPSIRDIDLQQLVDNVREQRAARKRTYGKPSQQ